MNPLKSHVEHLFSGYKENKQIKELKEEILSNLEAKVADLTVDGMEYNQAVIMATRNIDSVDDLIDGNKKVYSNRFKLEFIQIALLYSLIAWIVTIPLGILNISTVINTFLLIIVFMIAILFLILNTQKKISYLNKITIYNMNTWIRFRKIAWLIWGLFMIAAILGITAIHFGSNLWFSRPISISGPYQFAVIVVNYALPFISIIIPLLINTSLKLIHKYEVGVENESKE